jgi:hypothetical protein
MHDELVISPAKDLVYGPIPRTPYGREWWVGCPEAGPHTPSQTTLLHLKHSDIQPCNVTVIYVSHAASGIYGLGTLTTRPGELGAGPEALRFSLRNAYPLLGAGASSGGLMQGLTAGAFLVGPGSQDLVELRDYLAPQNPQTSVAVSLRELLRWVGGSAELLAGLLGASRRSIYNWLNGKAVRGGFAARAVRLATVLEPLGEEWHSDALVAWLNDGSPVRSELARGEHWVELDEQVRQALTPLLPQIESEAEDVAFVSPEQLSNATLIAVLEEFGSPPPLPARTRDDWRPRELTGATPGPDEG